MPIAYETLHIWGYPLYHIYISSTKPDHIKKLLIAIPWNVHYFIEIKPYQLESYLHSINVRHIRSGYVVISNHCLTGTATLPIGIRLFFHLFTIIHADYINGSSRITSRSCTNQCSNMLTRYLNWILSQTILWFWIIEWLYTLPSLSQEFPALRCYSYV